MISPNDLISARKDQLDAEATAKARSIAWFEQRVATILANGNYTLAGSNRDSVEFNIPYQAIPLWVHQNEAILTQVQTLLHSAGWLFVDIARVAGAISFHIGHIPNS